VVKLLHDYIEWKVMKTTTFLVKTCFSQSVYALWEEGMEGQKAPTTRTSVQKRQRHHFHEPYADVRGDLESGEGVATLSSNFWFRKLLKDAT
jgi:hypothetical protein